jgi:prepilin-type N-terminal cleavage/methylation domain-containing protein
MRTHRRYAGILMARHASARRAMTLLELTAVVFIVGIVAVMAVSRFGSLTLSNVGAQGFARELSLDCLQARRRAISTGDDHLLRFTFAGPNATQYALYRRQGANLVLVDDVHKVPDGVTVTTGGTVDMEFTFTGDSLAAYTVSVQGPDRTWSVNVAQATGKAFVQEL